jgi:aspartyl protease family protein
MEGSVEFCPSCARTWRRKQTLKRAGLAVAMLLVVGVGGGGVLWLGTRPKPPPPPPPAPPKYGSYTGSVEHLQALLAKEPCDRKTVLSLAQLLLKADVPREVIGLTDGFVTKCGAYERLLWEQYSAQKRLSEFGPAAETAGKLMEANPSDLDYPWWRGEMEEAQGKLEEAIVDYRLSLSLLPSANSIHFMLVDALIKAGRPCEALEPLELYLFFHPERRETTAVQTRMAKLEAEKCQSEVGEGAAVFRAPPKARSLRAYVKFNGKVAGDFIIDTGASSVVLSKSFAEKLALTAPSRPIRVRTAAGIKTAQLTTVALVETQGARAKNVEAVVVDDFGEDGLLGLSFLSRFAVTFDSKAQTLTLKPRKN